MKPSLVRATKPNLNPILLSTFVQFRERDGHFRCPFHFQVFINSQISNFNLFQISNFKFEIDRNPLRSKLLSNYFFKNLSTPRLQSSVIRVIAFNCTPASSAASKLIASM